MFQHPMEKRTPYKNLDDADLIRLAQKGDQQAFTIIVRRHEATVFRFAYKLCRDQEKAEETYQDTFVNVYRKLKQFDSRAKFTTWLYRIVANNCLMKHRVRKLDQASISIHAPDGFTDEPPRDTKGHPLQTIASWKESPHDRVANKELREILDAAIERLPSDHRVVFVLRDVEGLSAEETAKVVNISVPAVKSRLHRARSFLREQLNEYMKV